MWNDPAFIVVVLGFFIFGLIVALYKITKLLIAVFTVEVISQYKKGKLGLIDLISKYVSLEVWPLAYIAASIGAFLVVWLSVIPLNLMFFLLIFFLAFIIFYILLLFRYQRYYGPVIERIKRYTYSDSD